MPTMNVNTLCIEGYLGKGPVLLPLHVVGPVLVPAELQVGLLQPSKATGADTGGAGRGGASLTTTAIPRPLVGGDGSTKINRSQSDYSTSFQP